MRRYLKTFVDCLPVVLLLLVCAAWVRSYIATDSVVLQRLRHRDANATFIQTKIAAGAGGLGYERRSTSGLNQFDLSPECRKPLWWSTSKSPAYPNPYDEKFLGFHFSSYAAAYAGRRYADVEVTVPYWSIAILLAIGPFILFVYAWRRNRQIMSGFCSQCGYDLRATPDRCPECGTVVVTSETPSRPA